MVWQQHRVSTSCWDLGQVVTAVRKGCASCIPGALPTPMFPQPLITFHCILSELALASVLQGWNPN